MSDSTRTPASSNGYLPDHLAIEWLRIGPGEVRGRFTAQRFHMAPNGFLHAASVIALADSACGIGCARTLPEGAGNFTTVELKSNFLGTARVGESVICTGRLVHGGRTTQVWDAEVRNETTDKAMALFRCTQLLIYPKP